MYFVQVFSMCRVVMIIRLVYRGRCSFNNVFLFFQFCGRVYVFLFVYEEFESFFKNRQIFNFRIVKVLCFYVSFIFQKRSQKFRRVKGFVLGFMVKYYCGFGEILGLYLKLGFSLDVELSRCVVCVLCDGGGVAENNLVGFFR